MPEVQINIMDQYHPDNLCNPMLQKYQDRYKEIARAPAKEEIKRAYKYANDLNLNFKSLSYEKFL